MSNETEEQKQKRFKEWADGERIDIETGGCRHTSWAQKDISIGGQLMAVISPVVRLSNDDDPFYVQTFRTRDELEAFITELRKDADEAWGNTMTNAFDIKNPAFKVDTKALERSAMQGRIQSGVVNKKRKEGVELSLMGTGPLNKNALEPKAFYYFSKAGAK